MNKKVKFLTRLLTLALSLVLLASAAEPAYAQRKPKKEPEIKSAIPKDKRTWGGFPWLVGGVLAAATIALGIKSAKRTHLD
jgi:hypothetical protein